MSFNSLFPWEFSQAFPFLINKDKPGLYVFSCYDPFLEKIFLNSIPKSALEGDGWKVLAGSEVGISWLEDNLSALDFFSSSQSFKVLLSEDIPAKAKEFILKADVDWSERYFLLTFSKEDKFFDALKKKKEATVLKVKEPPFWDMPKLVKFLCEQTGVNLSYKLQNYLLEIVPNEPGALIVALKKLMLLGGPPQSLTPDKVLEILGQERLNKFELARLWSEKQHRDFYKTLLELIHDFNGLREFFSFLQGHIVKMVDPSYIDDKARPSKYDRQIESSCRMWSKAELRDEMRFFGECEILAKSRSRDLQQALRLKLIESY